MSSSPSNEPDSSGAERESEEIREDFDSDDFATLDSGSISRPDSDVPESQARTVDPAEQSSPDDFDPGTTYAPPGMPARIAGFLIRGVVGSGGMGTVYLARQDHPRRTVAIKVINPGVTNQRALKRFEFEAQMLARLQHPGIAQIFEAGTWDEGAGSVPYFAMEYIPGAKMITDYAEDRKLDSAQRIALMAKACEAVGYGHGKGVIHRDLKPGNILVTSDGDPKIIDFGVARSTDSDAAATMATGANDIVGTLQYMAPEQCSGDVHDLDFSADVYALGVTLYELLTKALPYEVSGVGLASAIRIIVEDSPKALSAVNSGFRGDLEVVVNKALAKDRNDRYRTASDLADDLNRYLAGDAILASPPTLLTSLRRTIRKNKAAVVGMAIIMLLLGASAVAGVFALVNRNAALESRNDALTEQAEKHAMVGELLGFYMRDTLAALTAMSSTPEVREQFLKMNMTYIDHLQRESGDDPTLMRVAAEGLWQMGHNSWSMRGGSRGDVDTAITRWKEAFEILQGLIEANPDDLAARSLAIETCNSLFQAGLKSGSPKAAESWLARSEELALGLPRPKEELDQWLILLDVLRHRETLNPQDVNPLEDETLQELVAMVDRGTKRFRDPNGVDLRVMREATLIWNKVAYRLSEADKHEASLAYYRRAQEAREAILAGERPGESRESIVFARRDLNNSIRYVATELLNLDRMEEAIDLLQEDALPAIRQLAYAAPSDIRAQIDLAQVLTEIGIYLQVADRSQEAVVVLRDSISGWQLVASVARARVTDDLRATRQTIYAAASLTLALLAQGEIEAAEGVIEQTSALTMIAMTSWPDNAGILSAIDELRKAQVKLVATKSEPVAP